MYRYRIEFKQPKDNTVYVFIGTLSSFSASHPQAKIIDMNPNE